MEKNKLNEWWNLNGNYKILHKINPLRVNFILKSFENTLKKKNTRYWLWRWLNFRGIIKKRCFGDWYR